MQFKLKFAFTLVLVMTAQAVAAGEKVIYLQMGEFPSVERIQNKERAQLEKTLKELPENVQKWAAYKNARISYVVEQHWVGLIEENPCASSPIRVELIAGKLISAKYAVNAGKCKKGQTVSKSIIKKYNLLLRPEEFFSRAGDAKSQLACYSNKAENCMPASLSVTYDEKYGIPRIMNDGSDLTYDYAWSLEVADFNIVE